MVGGQGKVRREANKRFKRQAARQAAGEARGEGTLSAGISRKVFSRPDRQPARLFAAGEVCGGIWVDEVAFGMA